MKYTVILHDEVITILTQRWRELVAYHMELLKATRQRDYQEEEEHEMEEEEVEEEERRR